MKKKLRILLTALTLMLVMIPLTAFAKSYGTDCYPTSIEFSAPNGIYYYKGVNDLVDEYRDMYNSDNVLTVHLSDGTTEEYKYIKDKGWRSGDSSAYYVEWRINNGVVTIEYDWLDEDYNEKMLTTTVNAIEEPYPTSLVYEGADLMYYPEQPYNEANGLYTENNKITAIFSDNTSQTYICKAYKDEDGDDRTGYFLDGDLNNTRKNFEVDIPDKGYAAGTNEISIYTEFEYGYDYKEVSGKVHAKAYPRPKSLSYEGAEILYRADEWDAEGFYTAGNKITLSYDDGSKKVYICKSYKDDEGYNMSGYFLNGDTSKITDEDGDTYFKSREWFDLDIDSGIKAGTTKLQFSGEFSYGDDDVKVTGTVPAKERTKPVSATFSGKTNPVYIGQKELWTDVLEKKGNKITITYSDNTQAVYKYITYKKGKYTYSGFYLDGNKNKRDLWGSANTKIKKGKNNITFNLNVSDDDDYFYNVKLKNITVTAKKLYAYAVNNKYQYTGKKITPKIVVKDGKGKTIPAKAYTVKYFNAKGKLVKKPYGKKYGRYDYQITFKKAYKKKYLNPIWGDYEIVPKAPTLKSVSAGSGKFTVKWGKVSGSDGYTVEYSTKKNFADIYAEEFAKGKTSATIRYLDKGKTYYVRVCTRKKMKNSDGDTYYVMSKPSKVKAVKVK